MSRDLFSSQPPDPDQPRTESPSAPLAERIRPTRLEDVVGQDHLLAEGKMLHQMIRSDQVPSLIFWGPPGVGKTTLARIIAQETKSHFIAISAVLSGIKEVKQVMEEAGYQKKGFSRRTILFVDEIHRFNKAQQDAFLPHVEKGTITLIGATTENPSFEVISPLLSRTRVLVLEPLQERHLVQLLQRALKDEENGLGKWGLEVKDEALERIATFANGDARIALNSLEVAAQLAVEAAGQESAEVSSTGEPSRPTITKEIAEEALQRRTLLYDRAGEEHFNLISALHKSLRNSDVDASLYWLVRMLEAGEEPLYIARRMVRFASEDVGLADPGALARAIAAMQAVDFIGQPEGNLALVQLAVYLAQAPKSNAVYVAYGRVQNDVANTRNEPVPLHIRNAPTRLMKDLGYAKGYRYAHDEEDHVADMDCLPPSLAGKRYYYPTDQGFEKTIQERLERLRELRKAKKR
ncbi:MAG: replication-associated recombination protein A [Acidobacteria bacterium]|nr:MAG: replication-associated recombination protein A [Acidobacteriota bacterium]